MSDERRVAVARRVVEAQKCFCVFNVEDHCWASPATEAAMQQAEAAFACDDYDSAEQLRRVTPHHGEHNSGQMFQANPEAWIAKMRHAAELRFGEVVDQSTAFAGQTLNYWRQRPIEFIETYLYDPESNAPFKLLPAELRFIMRKIPAIRFDRAAFRTPTKTAISAIVTNVTS
jgi:hypothetical protein